MALIVRSRVNSRFPSLWVDPDPTQNRIFLDNFGYDFTTLAPKFNDQWYWQNRMNMYNTSQDFDNFTPMQTSYMDGNNWAEANNTGHSMPGIFDLWLISLDYQNYKPRRTWMTALGRVMITYPRANDTNQQYGDWWMGYDMAKKSQSWRHQDPVYYCHIYEQTETIDFIATSWSYSTTTITVTKTNHGLYFGDIITVSDATATTFAPNGLFSIVTAANADTFTYQVANAPTGTAGGNMRVQATVHRNWGMQHEGRRSTYAASGMSVDFNQGYNYTYNDNDATTVAGFRGQAAVSRPFTIQGTLRGGCLFFLGMDATHFWSVRVDTQSAANHPYAVYKYNMQSGTATETAVLADTTITSALQSVIMPFPSNIRSSSATRIVFYSSHYSTTQLAPMRLVWDKTAGTITTTECTLNYPAGTTFTTYSALPTANNYDAFGYNVWWIKGHQFTVNGVDYITFCQQDKFIYSNNARWPTRTSRTWLTFSIGSGTDDNVLTFHSALLFETTSEFPLSWMPYTQDGTKLVVSSTINTSIYYFDPTEFNADSWSYVTEGSMSMVTVTKTAHGLRAGMEITISGTSTSTNSPNGTYVVNKVVNADTFVFVVDANTTGVPTGEASGTMRVASGWQISFATSIRARGFAVDSMGRLWLGVRTSGIARTEVHMIKDNMPSKVNIQFDNPLSNTTNKIEYPGVPIAGNVLVDSFDYYGARLTSTLNLTIKSQNMIFAGGSKLIQITTSSSQSTRVPVEITGPGQTFISATTNI